MNAWYARWAAIGCITAAMGLGQCWTAAAADKPSEKYATQWNAKAESLGLTEDYDAPPKLKKQTKPVYPKRAFRSRIQGTVVVLFAIDARGRVLEPEVVESIPGLDDAALHCVRRWRFEPARKAGVPVRTAAIAPITFRIYDKPRS